MGEPSGCQAWVADLPAQQELLPDGCGHCCLRWRKITEAAARTALPGCGRQVRVHLRHHPDEGRRPHRPAGADRGHAPGVRPDDAAEGCSPCRESGWTRRAARLPADSFVLVDGCHRAGLPPGSVVGGGSCQVRPRERLPGPGTSQGCLGGSGPGSWLSLVLCQHPIPSRDRRQPGHGRGRRSRAARSPCISTRSDAGISPSACAGFRRYSTPGTGPGSPRTPRARRWWLRSSAAARPGHCTTRRQVFPVSSRRSRPPSALSTAALSSSAAICGYMQPAAR